MPYINSAFNNFHKLTVSHKQTAIKKLQSEKVCIINIGGCVEILFFVQLTDIFWKVECGTRLAASYIFTRPI